MKNIQTQLAYKENHAIMFIMVVHKSFSEDWAFSVHSNIGS